MGLAAAAARSILLFECVEEEEKMKTTETSRLSAHPPFLVRLVLAPWAELAASLQG